MKKINGVIMQYFEWYLESKGNFWKEIPEKLDELSKYGITALWLPPAYKGIGGINEVGYGVYDLYDLGEFDQKGSIKTKYGSKEEYIETINCIRQQGMEVYADIVLNHKMGADKLQTISASKVDWGDHNKKIGDNETVKVATKFTFPGRNHKYSDFEWNWTHFKGIDYNEQTKEKALFEFKDKNWEQDVDEEFANYDYLMGADLDFENNEVVEECKNWGKWYVEQTKVEGFRLDAVKHISSSFYKDWIQYMRNVTKKELFAVGEYWSYDVEKLHRYITQTEGKISLFDVPLHGNFYQASKNEEYDMSKILENTLMGQNPLKAVTFVDNHDTQPGQSLQSFVECWFKPLAYAIILLREEGYPCVFYGDYYGIPHDNIGATEELKTLLLIRKEKAYGKQNTYFDHPHIIGWTREGDYEHTKSGIAVLISNREEGRKRMYIGTKFSGMQMMDAMGNVEEVITIAEDGTGEFAVKERSISVWVII